MLTDKNYYLALDLGTGLGTKIALFQGTQLQIAEKTLKVESYGNNFNSYTEILEKTINSFLKACDVSPKKIEAAGIASAGILKKDGSFQLIQNFPSFNGYNLKTTIEDMFSLPTAIDNDANAGGLAEWSILRMEILYWVFGGGWGGAWISKEGDVKFPSTDWNGKDESLHQTNEPGYIIPLNKLDLKSLFYEVNGSYERFEKILYEEKGEKALIGPCGKMDTIRAEVILSGPGRSRLFRAIVGDDNFYERFLDKKEAEKMTDPSVAGEYISKLSGMRVESAINTDRLYGKILAYAARELIKNAKKDGMPDNIPICLGGKPSYALPYFGPSTQRILGKMGFMNYMRPSVIDDRGINANLMGAAVLASKAIGLN
ncbi:MAG: ROK family protein [Spirochaetales bacterium]|nr:ROK family protein [Spirochaetales bacterium]